MISGKGRVENHTKLTKDGDESKHRPGGLPLRLWSSGDKENGFLLHIHLEKTLHP